MPNSTLPVHRTIPICSFITIFILISACGSDRSNDSPSGETQNISEYSIKGTVLQTLAAFDNPESAAFSVDGRHVFISNAAELGVEEKFHLVEKAGYISKLAVGADGTLIMVAEKLVTELSGPLGLTVSTVATQKFPSGTIFVCCGASGMAEPDGTPIVDSSRLDSKLVAFNEEGDILGELPMASGSAFARVSGAPAMLPNAAAFDSEGNLYVADTGNGAGSFEPPLEASPGIYRVPHASLDALAAGKALPEPLTFIPIPGGPDGVGVHPLDGNVHVNTVGFAAGVEDVAQGGMYKLTQGDFQNGTLPEPFAKGLGALDGLTFIGAKRLDTEIRLVNAVLVTAPGEEPRRLVLQPETATPSPADIAVRELEGGETLLVIPIPEWQTPQAGENPIIVVKLPREF